MKCKKAEKFLLQSFDGLLKPTESEKLQAHLSNCLTCQRKKREYQVIFDVLESKTSSQPRSFFWKRLEAKFKDGETRKLGLVWKYWGKRAIPVSLILVFVFTAGILMLPSQEKMELSKSEVLLLRDDNPFTETKSLFEQEGAVEKNMMLIFTSLEENNSLRSYSP
ncbi:MAG: hypothetical protein ACOC6P_02230 [Candidatus Aminicenantaceae bacterium]